MTEPEQDRATLARELMDYANAQPAEAERVLATLDQFYGRIGLDPDAALEARRRHDDSARRARDQSLPSRRPGR